MKWYYNDYSNVESFIIDPEAFILKSGHNNFKKHLPNMTTRKFYHNKYLKLNIREKLEILSKS